MENNQLLSIIHASEDIDDLAVKIKKDTSIERCKLHLAESLKISYTIESFLNYNLELSEYKHTINDVIADLRIAYDSKNINEIHSKMSSCIYSNSIIYANLIEFYKKLY